jgi:hypothetical protein
MRLASFEPEADRAAAELAHEIGSPERMAGEVAFCTQPNCGGILRKRGQGWICPVCGTRYDGGKGATTAGTVGPPQGHTKGARGSTWQKHTKRRAGGPEKKDRRRHRESEFAAEMEGAAFELEAAEPFYTKVTPIPGIGNKEGHEILTRVAMRGLPLSAADQSAILLGVIRPDRGGRSYWNFPRAALEALKAAAQPSHALRPTPSSTVSAALRLIRARFALLYLRAMRAPRRSTALEWLGEALHLLQDSFSSAHTERIGGTGRIRHIRAFFIRFGWPPLSRAPKEHNAPSDPRDDVYLHGTLRPEARAAIRASHDFLTMALRHLRAPHSPRNAVEVRAFMSRFLSM